MTRKLITALLASVIVAGTAFAATINGAGATFPYPIYSKWMSEYNKATGTKVNYASIGSGGGIRQFTAGVVDFGGTDAYMTDDELGKIKSKVLHIPTVMGAVAVIYNLGADGLKLDGQTLAKIFLGEIKKWNDPQISALNPGLQLPDADILVVHRSDGSGTTSIFTEYLAKTSTAWASKVGAGKAVAWPAGIGAKGNEGVTGAVKNNKRSIGYAELAYAEQNKLSTVKIRNRSGAFVGPSIDGVTAAADKGIGRIPSDFRGSIVNMPGAETYPISGLTWIVVKQTGNGNKAEELKGFLKWALTKGQKFAPALHYAPLPDSLANKVLGSIDTIE